MRNTNPVKKHFDEIAADYDLYKKRHDFYYRSLKKLLASFIPPRSKVLEIGCGTGDLIAFVSPSNGFGFDISSAMIKKAKRKHKQIRFSTVWPGEKFDYIFMSDVVEHLDDPEKTFSRFAGLMNKNSLFIITMANPVWEPVLLVAEKLKLKMPEGPHKRISYKTLKKYIKNAGLKINIHDYKLLMPLHIPIVTKLVNDHLEGPLKKLAFIEYFTATKL